jgi:hypothetical protein
MVPPNGEVEHCIFLAHVDVSLRPEAAGWQLKRILPAKVPEESE